MADPKQQHGPWIDKLRERLGDIASLAPRDLELHGRDEGYHREYEPGCVIYARSKQDILDTLEIARELGLEEREISQLLESGVISGLRHVHPDPKHTIDAAQ